MLHVNAPFFYCPCDNTQPHVQNFVSVTIATRFLSTLNSVEAGGDGD